MQFYKYLLLITTEVENNAVKKYTLHAHANSNADSD